MKKRVIRDKYTIYLSKDEYEIIKDLVYRVSPEEKNKPIGQIIRRGILALAENPDLDFVFDPGVCLNLTSQEIKLRQRLYTKLIENIELLKIHGVSIGIGEEGEIDESESETIEEDPS